MHSKKPDTTLLFELEISSRLISKKFSATVWSHCKYYVYV